MDTKHLIIADGQRLSRESLKKALIEKGLKIVGEAATGKEVVELNLKLKPDLIFMDINMPDLNGIETAKEISLTNPTPIILLTVKNDPDIIESAKITGVMVCLVKPFNKKELVPNIEIAITRFKEHKAVLEDNTDLKAQLKARKFIERAKGIIMEKYNISESVAFRKIQKASMTMHRSMQEISESIILNSEI